MKSIFIVIAILFLFGLINSTQQDDPNRCEKCGEPIGNGVNAGASSSTRENIGRCQKCEIQNYVNRMVFLMLSEDKSGHEDLMYMLDSRYNEMEAFYDSVNSYINQGVLGNNGATININDVTAERNLNVRFELFKTLVQELILELLQAACTIHYRSHTYYDYNQESKGIFVYRRQAPEANGCLCSDDDHCRGERLMTTFPLKVPEEKTVREDMVLVKTIKEVKKEISIEGVTAYQIIPLATISRFFRTWLGSEEINDHTTLENSLPQNHFNGCVKTLLKRLKRSIQKIILVSIKKSLVFQSFPRTSVEENKNENDFTYDVNNIMTLKDIENSFSWLGGNIFIGPSTRGPFLPTFQHSPEEAFDTEAEPIIGRIRYLQLMRLFDSLTQFNNHASNLSPFERLIHGFKLYAEMTIAFTMHPVTQLNWDDWVLRELIYEELNNIQDPQTRAQMAGSQYFTTKKLYRRDPRSILQNEIELSVREERAFKNHWSDFITDVMKVSMGAQSRNQTLPWLCEIAKLYDNFLSPRIDPFNYDCGICPTFSEFLQTEILNSNGWSNCFDADYEVCSAWRNIIKILDDQKGSRYPEYRLLDKTTWKLYLDYMETVVNWLSSPVEIKSKEELKKSEYHLIQMPPHPAHKITFIETSLCFLTTIVPSVLFMKSDCKKMQNQY